MGFWGQRSLLRSDPFSGAAGVAVGVADGVSGPNEGASALAEAPRMLPHLAAAVWKPTQEHHFVVADGS